MIYVVAKHHAQYARNLSRLGRSGRTRYVRGANDLRGLGSGHTALLLDGCDTRKDWPDIEAQLAFLDAMGVQIVDQRVSPAGTPDWPVAAAPQEWIGPSVAPRALMGF